MAPTPDILDSINRIVGNAVRWLAVAMVLAQFTIVLLRHLFGVSDIALNESVLYMHATLFMLGAGYTLLVDKHVRVDLFGYLVLLVPSMTALLWWSWPSVRNAWKIVERAISVGGIRGYREKCSDHQYPRPRSTSFSSGRPSDSRR